MDRSLVTAAMGAQTGLTQLSLATSMLKMNSQNGSSVVKLIDSAQQTMNSLANLAPGVGTNWISAFSGRSLPVILRCSARERRASKGDGPSASAASFEGRSAAASG
jgi:hypothetical protein